MQRIQNTLHDALFILKNVVVPETQDAEALGLEISVPLSVRRRVMLAAVRFDDQPMAKAGEIGDVMVYGELAFELVSYKSLSPENLPKPMLGVGWGASHCLGA